MRGWTIGGVVHPTRSKLGVDKPWVEKRTIHLTYYFKIVLLNSILAFRIHIYCNARKVITSTYKNAYFKRQPVPLMYLQGFKKHQKVKYQRGERMNKAEDILHKM